MSEILKNLIKLADELDQGGFIELAQEIDALLPKVARLDWRSSSEFAQKKQVLDDKLESKQITEQQWRAEMDKLTQQGRDERNPYLEKMLYQKIQKEKQQQTPKK